MSESFGTRNLPVELLLHIIRTGVSKEDLCQLRSVNSTFNKLATRAIFENITVYNKYESADRFWTVLHTPHIAQHVQSLTFVEKPEHIETETLERLGPVRKRIEAAFALLHRVPKLKTLALFFNPAIRNFSTHNQIIFDTYSHQWDIIAALGSNQNPLPQLRSLTIHQWLGSRKWNSLYDAGPFSLLVMSLRHLSFSVAKEDSDEPHMQFWKPVVVQGVLQRAIRLESLAINRNGTLWNDQCLDVSELPTYPRLAALSLRDVLWEDGKLGDRGVVELPAVEDFIARHRKTLKKLKLQNCVIGISPGRATPVCYWADIYTRLAKALTELVELEVEFHIDGLTTQYIYLSHHSSHMSCKTLDGTEQDGLSLEEFKAVVNSSTYSGTGAGSMPQL